MSGGNAHAGAGAAARGGVGRRTPLIDGIEKVTGRARYTADLPLGPALVGRILRSPVAHGLIRGIDSAKARAMPGVRAVVTGEDFAAPYGVIPIAQNEWPLARGKVRYRGEPVVAVAAVDEATAEAALRAIVLDIEPLPAYFSADDARADDAVPPHDNKAGNIERRVDQTFGDDGAAPLTFERDEIVTRLFVPAPAPGLRSGYRKARVRGAMDFPLAGVACALRLSGGAVAELRVALTGTNSQPLLLQGTEALVGKPLGEAALAALGKLVHKQVSPMRTTVTPSNYRRLVAAVHAQRLLRDLAAMPAPN